MKRLLEMEAVSADEYEAAGAKIHQTTNEAWRHYAVANIPSAVARTSTMSLTNNTSQYGVLLANKGLDKAAKANAAFAKAVNTHEGAVKDQPVAETHTRRSNLFWKASRSRRNLKLMNEKGEEK
ncbi:hypothetical protein [Lentibacillus amyloliquefaciens]|uniref:Alanine dehydrogenase/pyridine nucleotide transhydrogenase NAD(H)-binding domain-containing protein n=1 Tax=Lentibacillus amyloliquefaciens TaxID=1472767 RepID=A0A0U4EA54_9BACI|nr:hypothetical protein [Lentibacillus amyloliquefaciens]ALX50156.1 hypothetical protein AOX59_17180 [Lentibacillus amyloliquefaciens]